MKQAHWLFLVWAACGLVLLPPTSGPVCSQVPVLQLIPPAPDSLPTTLEGVPLPPLGETPKVDKKESSESKSTTKEKPKTEKPDNKATGKTEAKGDTEKKEKSEKKDEKKEEKKDDKAKQETIDPDWGFRKPLFDSLHPKGGSGTKWFDKLSLRGYTQIRFGRTLERNNVTPQLLGDSNINGAREDFSLRRVRLILFGDVGEHLGIYIQPDFASTPDNQVRNTFFGQLRDCYGDVYLTTDKVHRIRAGLSKVPYGFENLQSSQNRIPLDRTEPVNLAVHPNERDLGLFYYWTPVEKQELFRDLVDGGLKGSGNYGIFGIGVYNGQGGSQLEQNRNLHSIARLTYPFRLESGQVIEASIQGYTGDYVVEGAELFPLGKGDEAIIPKNTRTTGDRRGNKGIREARLAGTFVYYPQPFGIQAEWQVGEGPGLSPDQRQVDIRSLHGGYVMAMYKLDSTTCGIFYPFVRYQYYKGGYRSSANAPYGATQIVDLGVEWQIWRAVELVWEYAIVDRLNTSTRDTPGLVNYRNFRGDVFRMQLQLNY